MARVRLYHRADSLIHPAALGAGVNPRNVHLGYVTRNGLGYVTRKGLGYETRKGLGYYCLAIFRFRVRSATWPVVVALAAYVTTADRRPAERGESRRER